MRTHIIHVIAYFSLTIYYVVHGAPVAICAYGTLTLCSALGIVSDARKRDAIGDPGRSETVVDRHEAVEEPKAAVRA